MSLSNWSLYIYGGTQVSMRKSLGSFGRTSSSAERCNPSVQEVSKYAEGAQLRPSGKKVSVYSCFGGRPCNLVTFCCCHGDLGDPDELDPATHATGAGPAADNR